MDHQLAIKTNAIEKYLLNELTQEERSEFEEHIFDCPECAVQIKQDFTMIESLKEVLGEGKEKAAPSRLLPDKTRPADADKERTGGWREWFRPFVLAPALATLALAVMVGYQNLVYIPALTQPQVLDSNPIVSTTRGSVERTVTIDPRRPLFGLTFEVDAPRVYDGYTCEFQAQGQGTVATVNCGKRPTAAFTLSLVLPARKFPPGVYTMILRPVSDAQMEVGRYSFAVREEDK